MPQTRALDVRFLALTLDVLIWGTIIGIVVSWGAAALLDQPLRIAYLQGDVFLTAQGGPSLDSTSGVIAAPRPLLWAAWFIAASPDVVLVMALARLSRLPRTWREGRFFDEAVTAALIRFSRLLLLAAFAGVLARPANHLLLAFAGYGPEEASILLPSFDFWLPAIVAAVLLVVSHALRRGAELQAEADLTV